MNLVPSLRLVLCSLALAGVSYGKLHAAALDGEAAVQGADISYQSDGLKITGIISKPAGRGPFPLVVINHGGFAPAKSAAGQMSFFAGKGYVAVASDYRGCGHSEGKSEVAKGEVNDVLNAIKFARTLPCVDGGRVVMWGFSHGASVSLLAASRDESIKAVVAVQGPVEMAEEYARWTQMQEKPGMKRMGDIGGLVGGTPAQMPAAWKERSALYVADKIKCPVLLIYSDGDADDIVPTSQGRRMEAALEASGNKVSKLLLIPGVGHGLNKETWSRLMPQMLEFLQAAK